MDVRANDAVVVGITGRGRDTAALRLAADCAGRDGLEVLLVHVFQESTALGIPGYVLPREEAEKVARAVVDEVSEEFEELAGSSVEFRAVTLPGTPARVLADLGAYATLLVVQHSRSTVLGRIVVGSTVDGVAAHAGCPVISVDEAWEPGAARGPVVAGVDGRGGPPQVLEAAFAWAAATGVPLRVVHAWRLDPAYDALVTGAEAARWGAEQGELLDTAIADLGERHPQVPVTVEVPRERRAEVLVEESRTASLLVLGRHAGRDWAPERLGSLVRTVLREAHSPVMVVPLRTSGGTTDRRREAVAQASSS